MRTELISGGRISSRNESCTQWKLCAQVVLQTWTPIEHVWDASGRRVAAANHTPTNFQELERVLLEEWGQNTSQLVINSHH
ncbi:hypothetical protein TNCV_4557741 [Trichonephila clavipes]|nr:hypothetical protein TNCV_4557741 [Trichonephila clavipes]